MRLISNSEISSWLKCKRKYYFEYVMDLEPSEFSGPISKGILIHSILENYYASKALGLPEQMCRDEGLSVLEDAVRLDNADIADLYKTRALMLNYFDHWQEDDDATYEVYAVETKLKADLSDDYALVGTIDLVWKNKETGKFHMVDHKSSYNFWTDAQADFSGQFVKYISLGRNHGLDIDSVIVNQVRTRELKEGNELFRRLYIRPTENKITDVMRQHILVSEEITTYRKNPVPELAVPVFDKFTCANCPYATLCDIYSNGGDLSYAIQQDYKKRTGYGYN